jgi:hypothetical protein
MHTIIPIISDSLQLTIDNLSPPPTQVTLFTFFHLCIISSFVRFAQQGGILLANEKLKLAIRTLGKYAICDLDTFDKATALAAIQLLKDSLPDGTLPFSFSSCFFHCFSPRPRLKM